MGTAGKQRNPKRQQQQNPCPQSSLSRADGSKRGNTDPNENATSLLSHHQLEQQQRRLHGADASCSCSDTDGVRGEASDNDLEGREMLRTEGHEEEDKILQSSSVLTVEEVLRRRSRRMRQLAKLYRRHYWALMEGLKLRYRDFYMKYGKSAWKDAAADGNDVPMDSKCAFVGCKSKPMALTSFCFNHILSDERQQLYKACSYVVKSGQTGPVICGTPILKAAVPSLCSVHFQKAEKHISRALKRAGLNTSSSSKPAPKFHILISEYVNHIQRKRREARNAAAAETAITDKPTNDANPNKDFHNH